MSTNECTWRVGPQLNFVNSIQFDPGNEVAFSRGVWGHAIFKSCSKVTLPMMAFRQLYVVIVKVSFNIRFERICL